jgi:quinol-cytochrome oxidoreductase complex cytochrome b subunit
MARKRARKNVAPELPMHRIAHYLFFLGIIIAILAGFFRNVVDPRVLVTTLILLGLIVGLFNITAKETHQFLLAAIALMLAGIVNLSLIPIIGDLLRAMLSNIVVFVVPGAIIVGLKTIWQLASD